MGNLRGENDEMRVRLGDQGELSRKNIEFESIIRQLRQENDRLGESSRKVGDYELRLTQFSMDLQNRNDEISRLTR